MQAETTEQTMTYREKVRWAETHYTNGFPDFSKFDDTDATRDGDGLTERDRACQEYYDLLDQRRD